jgi:hypothetical protein
MNSTTLPRNGGNRSGKVWRGVPDEVYAEARQSANSPQNDWKHPYRTVYTAESNFVPLKMQGFGGIASGWRIPRVGRSISFRYASIANQALKKGSA